MKKIFSPLKIGMFFISDYDWSVMERFEYETYDSMDPDPEPNPESQVISLDSGIMCIVYQNNSRNFHNSVHCAIGY